MLRRIGDGSICPCGPRPAALLPIDIREWIADDDLAHFVIEAVDRVPVSRFRVNDRGCGSAQYHPQMMLALLVYCYAHGVFSSRRIEQATFRDVGVRFVAASRRPDHDRICKFRRDNEAAIREAFLQVLLLACEVGLLRIGLVSVGSTQVDANASRHRNVRYDRAGELSEQLRAEISQLLERAEAADQEAAGKDERLPAEFKRREVLVARLEASRARGRGAGRAPAWLRANALGLAGPASGVTKISAHLSKQDVSGMLWGTIIATGPISLILLLVFRSVPIGLTCLVPNFVPAAMAFGVWGYLSGTIGLGASVVNAIAIGIIVDDTIHFLAKYLDGRRGGLSAPDSVRTTFRTVGPALWATTAILAAGFLVFSSSGYEPSFALGMLVAITVSFALIADLLLLPALLMAIERK